MSATYHIKNNKNDVYQRSTVADMLNPDNGYRGQLKRQGQPIKNHMKDNLNIIKITQQQNKSMKEKQIEEEQNKKELYKMPQFRDVSSRIYDQPSNPNGMNNNNYQGPEHGQKDFLTKNASQQRANILKDEKRQIRNQLDEELQLSKIHDIYRKPEVPKPTEIQHLPPRDFISQNRKEAFQSQSQQPTAINSSSSAQKHESYGRVPDYIIDRKVQKEYEEELRRRNAPDPDCPPGTYPTYMNTRCFITYLLIN